MSFYISYRPHPPKFLRQAGLRIGYRRKLKGWEVVAYGVFILMWWLFKAAFIGVGWMMYGCFWLMWWMIKAPFMLIRWISRSIISATKKSRP